MTPPLPSRPSRGARVPQRRQPPTPLGASATGEQTLRRNGPAAGAFSAEIVRDRIHHVPLDALSPNPDQPRKRFDPVALQGLADSIAARGVLQPALVSPLDGERFMIVAGERRWRACRLAGRDTIPVFVRASPDDQIILELALIENAAREDLTVVEEARTLAALRQDHGVKQEDLATRTGKSRTDISNTIRLLRLPDVVLDLLEAGTITKGHGKLLAATSLTQSIVVELAHEAAENGWTVRQLQAALDAYLGGRERGGVSPPPLLLVEQAAEVARRTGAAVRVSPRGRGVEIKLVVSSETAAWDLLTALVATST